MDMMKTLLIYLSATMALAVQSTSAPKEAPTPAPVTTAVVETADAVPGEETPVITAIPQTAAETPPAASATGKPTPAPVPTITPNTKAYHNLAMGAKGKEVKKLQEKLIEMKYLPEGAADGAFGRQTYHAVRKFQYYNGLKQDGVAGRATQTNLFENPEVVPNPEAADETPAPETTPDAEETEATEESDTAAEENEANGEAAEGADGEGGITAEYEDYEAETTPALTAVPPELLDQYMTADMTAKTEEDTENTETEPAEEPAEEPVEEQTEKPAGEPVEEPTPEPTAEPTEAPTPEPTPEPTAEPTAEPTEEPASEPTGEPEEEPAEQPTEEPAEELTEELPDEIIENVDLDADIYDEIIGAVALNEGNGPLEFIATEDGVPVTRRPRLAQNGARIRVSLDDLCRCTPDWRLTDDGVGTIVLEAAGYTLAIYNEESGCFATVDGTEIPMKDDDLDFSTEGHFINAEFLATALKGEAAWDAEENTLMLRIRDRTETENTD